METVSADHMLYRILFEVILEEIVDETSQMDYILYCTLLTIYQENEETRSGNKDLNLAPVLVRGMVCIDLPLGIAQMK